MSLLKQIQVLMTPIQKMIWFIKFLATVNELLVIKISKEMLTQQKFIINFIHRLQTLDEYYVNCFKPLNANVALI